MQTGTGVVAVPSAQVVSFGVKHSPNVVSMNTEVNFQNLSSSGGNVFLNAGTSNLFTTDVSLTGTITALAGTAAISTSNGTITSTGAPQVVNAQGVSLTAPNGSIGTSSNPILVQMSNPSAGVLNASTVGNIFITETSGTMRVGAVSSTSGNVVLATTYSSTPGQDMVIPAASSISTPNGSVTLDVADNFTMALLSTITSQGKVLIQGDFGNPNTSGTGSVISISGVINTTVEEVDGGVLNDVISLTNVVSQATATVNTVVGTNVVNVGSVDPFNGGVVDGVQGVLLINGAGDDTLNVDDTGSTIAKVGFLTSTAITGLNMGPTGVQYQGMGFVNIKLGSGGNTFTIENTITGQSFLDSGTGADVVNVQTTAGQTTVDTGGGVDTVNVGNIAPTPGSVVNGIQGPLIIQGDALDTTNVDDTGSTVAKSGVLTSTTLTGLAMGSSGITYSGLAVLNIYLGSGGNTFLVKSTHKAQTVIDSGSGDDFVNIQSIAGPTLINGQNGNNTFNLSSTAPTAGGIVDNINAVLSINGGSGVNVFNIDDTGSTISKTGFLSATAITGLDMQNGSISYQNIANLNISLGSGGNVFTVIGTAPSTTTVLNTGLGNDSITVTSTTGPLTINAQSGTNSVQIGSAALGNGGLTSGIQGALVIHGNGGTNTLLVDDSGDTTSRTGKLTANSITGLGMAAGGIAYDGFSSVGLELGSGQNTFLIASTIAGSTYFNPGTNRSTVNVEAIGGPTLIDSTFQTSTINIGSLQPTLGGTLAGIGSTLTVKGGQHLDQLNLDDTGDALPGVLTLMSSTISGLDIPGSIVYTNAGALNLNLGPATNTVKVLSTGFGATTIAGGGGTTFDVQSISGSTTLNAGSGSNVFNVGSLAPALGGVLSTIGGSLVLSGGGATDVLNIDDSGDSSTQTGLLSSNALTGLGMAKNGVTYTGMSSLDVSLGNGSATLTVLGTEAGPTTVSAGNGNDVFNIRAISGPLTIDGGSGSSVFNVGSQAPASGGVLSGIVGTLLLNSGAGSSSLNIDDSGDATNQSAFLSAGNLQGLGLSSALSFDPFTNITITLGSGNDTFSLTGFQAGTAAATINGGPGVNTFSANINGDFSTKLTLLNFAEVTSFVISGNLNSPVTLSAPGKIDSMTIGGSLTQTGSIQASELDSLKINGDLAGTVSETGFSSGVLQVGGSIASTGVVNWVGTLTNVSIAGDDAGALQDFTNIVAMNIGGSLTSTGLISSGSIHDLAIAQDLAGKVTVTNNLDILTVGGNVTGSYTAGSLGSVTIGGKVIPPSTPITPPVVGPTPTQGTPTSFTGGTGASTFPSTTVVTIGGKKFVYKRGFHKPKKIVRKHPIQLHKHHHKAVEIVHQIPRAAPLIHSTVIKEPRKHAK